MQAVFYGVSASVIGIIVVSAYHLTKKTIAKDWLLWIIYTRCNVCGNEVTVTKVGGGELVCCGQPMEKIEG